jgi:hypothetical protein
MEKRSLAARWLQNKYKEQGYLTESDFNIAAGSEIKNIELAFYYGGIDFQQRKEIINAKVPYINEAKDYVNEIY